MTPNINPDDELADTVAYWSDLDWDGKAIARAAEPDIDLEPCS